MHAARRTLSVMDDDERGVSGDVRALAAMTLDERTALLTGFAALLAADENGAPAVPLTPTHRRPQLRSLTSTAPGSDRNTRSEENR